MQKDSQIQSQVMKQLTQKQQFDPKSEYIDFIIDTNDINTQFRRIRPFPEDQIISEEQIKEQHILSDSNLQYKPIKRYKKDDILVKDLIQKCKEKQLKKQQIIRVLYNYIQEEDIISESRRILTNIMGIDELRATYILLQIKTLLPKNQNVYNLKKAIKKQLNNKGPGRPRENEKFDQTISGIVQKPIRNDQDIKGQLMLECVIQFPLYLKCILNTIRQIEKNSNIEFCFTGSNVFLWYSESVTNKCLQSYYFKEQQQGFIKFDIPICHISNTFNFYNRSSLKTELSIQGPTNSLLTIDSHKSEKSNTQCITNTVAIQIIPSNEQLKQVEQFFDNIYPQQTQQPAIQKMQKIFKDKNLFNDCFFINYRPQKIYAFSVYNSDIRKFVTEVQKDCEKIQIRRDVTIKEGVISMKNIIMECQLPGSSSTKHLSGDKNTIENYREYKQTDVEKQYNIGSNFLKQITSNNPQGMLRFIMLDNQKIIIKIKDNLATFKFEITCID